MVRAKAPKKTKQQKQSGIDFKKIKKKVGRKLPPPNNSTNTEIKSKAIILPQQSVAADKAGHAVSKKGLTLKELLQQSSHHNPKVRKDALQGIQDLLGKHPVELKLHKFALFEKLRERVGDTNESVRKALYQLFKSVIFPGCKEDNQGPLVAVMMAYIFHAMAHLALDVQLMAFKFFDLVVQYYPPSFVLYAEKILQNYKTILLKNELYRQDKGKLKCALEGLVHCLSLLPCNDKEEDHCEKEVVGQRILHEYQVKISTADHSGLSQKLKDLMLVLVTCFKELFSVIHDTPSLDDQSFDCLQYTLQSIDITVKIFICQHKRDEKIQGYSGGSNTNIWDENVASMFTMQLLEKFPITSVHHFSAKDDGRYFMLNIVMTEIFSNLREWIYLPAKFSEKFFQFIESSLLGQKSNAKHAQLAFQEKHLESLLQYIPGLVSHVPGFWKSRLLQAFTHAFMVCKPESSMKLACLSTIKKMLIPYYEDTYLDGSHQEILTYQITWIRELVPLLMELSDKHPSSSEILLQLLLFLGQSAPVNPSIVLEYDNLQCPLEAFFATYLGDGNICYGPFTKLPKVCQELSICCLYYFTHLETSLLKSIAACCLCDDLAPDTFFRIVDIVESIFSVGHTPTADYIGFFLFWLSRLKVVNENCTVEGREKISDWETLLRATKAMCRCLSLISDKSVVLQLVEEAICDQLKLKPPRQNACAMLQVFSRLDSKPSKLSEESINVLGNFLPVYLMDVIQGVPVIEGKDGESALRRIRAYYLRPCFDLFDRSQRLVILVLDSMGSPRVDNAISKISALVRVLQLMHDDKYARFRQILSPFKPNIEGILQNISLLQSREESKMMTLEERHIAQRAYDHLREILRSISG